MNFGERLRSLRQAAGLSQEALSRLAEISLSQLNKIELKGVDPSWSTVIRLARALHVDVSAFDVLESEKASAEVEPPIPKKKPRGK